MYIELTDESIILGQSEDISGNVINIAVCIYKRHTSISNIHEGWFKRSLECTKILIILLIICTFHLAMPFEASLYCLLFIGSHTLQGPQNTGHH